MIDVRTWVYDRLVALDVVDDRIFSDLQETPDEKPFIVVRVDVANPDVPTAMFQDIVLWVEDEPGSYLAIDSILSAIRADMDGAQLNGDGVQINWQGDSIDLSDDSRKTILRTSSYRLVGRR